MSDPKTSAAPDPSTDITEFGSKLQGAVDLKSESATLLIQMQAQPEKMQLQLIQQLSSGGLDVLMELLLERRSAKATVVDGKIYEVLLKANSPVVAEFLQKHFPTGVVPLRSDREIDYTELQQLLARQDFQAADWLTLQKLCELAGPDAVQRKWLYFTEVDNFPITDLQTIDTLWLVHSESKFGFSVQREIWLGVGQNWEKMWPKIGWKKGNNWTRYPQEFTWDLAAPRGHLPLSNQLRGVRAIEKLLSHRAWGSYPSRGD